VKKKPDSEWRRLLAKVFVGTWVLFWVFVFGALFYGPLYLVRSLKGHGWLTAVACVLVVLFSSFCLVSLVGFGISRGQKLRESGRQGIFQRIVNKISPNAYGYGDDYWLGPPY